MDDRELVEDIVEALDISGGSTKRRPVHTIGIGAKGFFEPSPIAHDYCIAEHFQPSAEKVPVDVRFSNGV
jgi:catalase